MSLSTQPGLCIIAEKALHSMSCNIFALDDRQSIEVDTLKSVPLEPETTIKPFLTVSLKEGQLLFDALFEAGYRKEGEAITQHERDALDAHIKSLRNMAEFQCDLVMRIIPEQQGE